MIDYRCKYSTNKGDGLRFSEKSLLLQHEIIKNSIIMQRFTKAIVAVMLMTAVSCIVGCTKPDEPNNVSGSLNGHDYVDLDLPSGTLWATCNVGANASEEYGDYFAWGETATKTTYNWSTYKYCYNGDGNQLTKYCNNSIYGYFGFTDTLVILQPEDDAATANWGSGWCIPTVDQWRELRDNTTNIWTTRNGVNGRLFTAANGNSLFLPAAGTFAGGTDNLVLAGNYWSNALDTDYPICAWNFGFISDEYLVYGLGRLGDCSVRAVCSSR